MNSASLSTWPHTYKPSTGSVHRAERVRPNRTSYNSSYNRLFLLHPLIFIHRPCKIVAVTTPRLLPYSPYYLTTTDKLRQTWRLPLARRVVCRNRDQPTVSGRPSAIARYNSAARSLKWRSTRVSVGRLIVERFGRVHQPVGG